MNWIAVCLLSLLPLSSPTKVDEACRLKVHMTTLEVVCHDQDCTPCSKRTVTMEGIERYSCQCPGGSYAGSCWGIAQDDGNELVLICNTATCTLCAFTDDGTWTWCTCTY